MFDSFLHAIPPGFGQEGRLRFLPTCRPSGTTEAEYILLPRTALPLVRGYPNFTPSGVTGGG
jgi:hypothetical protein